ncbi:MAG: M23 family metallopeptidase [Gemmatimonadetes bacterium]|nr:M23 family metallopeptidase [Gemmatimonadota bacterium]
MRKLLLPLASCLLAACWAGGVPRVAPEGAPSDGGARVTARSEPRPVAQSRDVRRSGSAMPAAPSHGPSSGDPEAATAANAARGATEIEALKEMELMVPVDGIAPAQIPDTYWSKRDNGRLHRAADIMAPKGTPVVAPSEGIVLKVGRNQTGGIVVYTTDTERRFVFYHAHLDRIADGLADGATLRQGDLLGYVGTTGNAPPNAPHLHFQVMRMPADGRYWEGMPVDVRPFLLKPGRAR